jgi:DNA-binding NarL/FixJ family response regulator
MLIEDSEDFREGIVCVLDETPNIKVASQYGTAEMALRNLQETAKEKLPDIILLDLNLPGMSGLDALPLIKQKAPETKIIILTQSDREADVLRAIRLGASGYLLKSASLDSLIDGIELVYSGGATLDANLARFILNALSGKQPEATPAGTLSKREREVLTLIAEGQARKQIADQLNIGDNTVKEYIHNIYSKLDVQNAPEAVAKAYRSGILPSGE